MVLENIWIIPNTREGYITLKLCLYSKTNYMKGDLWQSGYIGDLWPKTKFLLFFLIVRKKFLITTIITTLLSLNVAEEANQNNMIRTEANSGSHNKENMAGSSKNSVPRVLYVWDSNLSFLQVKNLLWKKVHDIFLHVYISSICIINQADPTLH